MSTVARYIFLCVLITTLVAPSYAVSYKVHAFYYPWYGNPAADGHWIHWEENGHHPEVDDLAAPFFPLLGGYSVKSYATIHQHMKWLEDAGIGVIALSWWGQGSYEDKRADEIVDIAAYYNVKVCFHIEPYGGRTPASVKNDVIYLISKHGNKPGFFRDPSLGNRPFFYVFVSGDSPDSQWAAAWDSIRGTEYDSVVIADTLNHSKVTAGHWDGFYNYFPGIDMANWKNHRTWATNNGKLFIAPIGPGYDDTQVRTTGPPPVPRQNGQYYDSTWSAAVNAGAHRVAITSFNEWHEGTQIEPAIPKTIATRTYQDYLPDIPTFYTDKTASWAAVYDPAASGKIQCEDYSGGASAQEGVDYHDTTPGNSGGSYRQQNVDIQPCSEGGYNIGWIAAGEWLRYTNVQVSRGGSQEIRIRGSAWNAPAQVRICEGSRDNTLLTLTIPVTGAFQKWQTVSGTVSLSEGAHTIYLVAESGDFNLNWFEIRPVFDITAPNIFIPTVQPSPWTNSFTAVTFSTTDNPGGSGIRHYEGRVNQGTWIAPITSPWIILPQHLTPGLNSINIRAYDYAGNYRDVTVMIGFDNVAPRPFTPVPNKTGWTDGDITISFATTDDLPGISRYDTRIDNGVFVTRTSPWTISQGSLTPGVHNIVVRAYDRAGNYTEGACQVYYAPEAPTIAAVKALPDGQFRSLKDKIVTFTRNGFFYIQEPDRTAGIKIVSNHSVQVGDIVELAGYIGGSSSERYIDCGSNPVFVK